MCRTSLNWTLSSSFLFSILITLFGCSRGETELPIREPLLIDVLCDVHIIEGALQNRAMLEKDSIANIYYNQVYQKHGISEVDFETTLEILQRDPRQLESIYSKVLVLLDTMENHSYKSKYKKK